MIHFKWKTDVLSPVLIDYKYNMSMLLLLHANLLSCFTLETEECCNSTFPVIGNKCTKKL